MISKTIKTFLKLFLVYIIFTAIILLGNRYHFRIPVEYDILDLNDIFGGILGGFAFVFFALPLSLLDLLNISWQVPGCSWICPPSMSAIIFILIFDIIELYIFALIIAFLKKLRERAAPINRRAKLIIILATAILGSVMYWFVNKNNFYSENENCDTGYYLGVLTPARHLASGKCEILPSSCIPSGYSTDIECDQWWQTKQEEGLQNTLNKGDSSDTSTWKTYRNEKYGFEVKYPADWKADSGKPQPLENIVFSNTKRMQPDITIFMHSRDNTNYIGGGTCSDASYHVVECSDRISINGVPYARITEAGMSTEQTYRERYIEVYIQTNKASLQFGTMTVDGQGKTPDNTEDTIKVFDQILSTFRFLK